MRWCIGLAVEARAKPAAQSEMNDLSQGNNLPMAPSALCYHYHNEHDACDVWVCLGTVQV